MTALPRHPLNPDCNWEWPWHFQSYEENNDNNVCYRGIHITLCTRNWWAEPDNWKTSVRSSTCTSTIVVVRLIVQSGKKRIAIIQNIVVLRSRSYFYEARHAGYIPQDKKGLSLNRLKKKEWYRWPRLWFMWPSTGCDQTHRLPRLSWPENLCVSHGSPAPEFGSHVRPPGGPSTAHAGGCRDLDWWDSANDTVMVTRPQWRPPMTLWTIPTGKSSITGQAV